MWLQLVVALRMLALMTLLTGALYPLLVTGIARVAFPVAAGGSLLVRDGQVIGSTLIGQSFASPGYFHGRASAVDYDAAGAGASNLGPTSRAWLEQVSQRALERQRLDGRRAPVPIELVTSSGSGLDPHLSIAAARYQVARVARERGLPEARVQALVDGYTAGPAWGFIGEPRVNVLQLNLALDAPH